MEEAERKQQRTEDREHVSAVKDTTPSVGGATASFEAGGGGGPSSQDVVQSQADVRASAPPELPAEPGFAPPKNTNGKSSKPRSRNRHKR